MFGRLLARRDATRMNETTDETTEGSDELTTRPVDRRGMLRLGGMAAAGAAGAAIVSAIDAPPAGAAGGDPLILGSTSNFSGFLSTSLNSNAADTLLLSNAASGAALEVSDNNVGTGPAITAHLDNTSNGSDAVVVRNAGSGAGINVSAAGNGVTAQSTGGGNGVYALNGTTTGVAGPAAIYGDSKALTGLFGTTTTGIGARGLHGGYSGQESLGGFGSGFTCGVIGEDNATGVGVIGASPSGTGVDGLSSAGTAVKAITASGTAVSAQTTGGTTLNPSVLASTAAKGPAVKALATLATNASPAVLAQTAGTGPAVNATTTLSTNPSPAVKATSASTAPAVQANGNSAGTGPALDVHGKATFTRSGVLTVPAGVNNALTAVVPGGLTAASHVLATIQLNSGTLAVRAAVPILTGGNINKIQIFLTGNAPTGGAAVGWFVFG